MTEVKADIKEVIALARRAEEIKKGSQQPDAKFLKDFHDLTTGLSEDEVSKIDLYSKTTQTYKPNDINFSTLEEKGADTRLTHIGYIYGIMKQLNQKY